MELQDKVIAITGGGRGIGAAMATRLAAEGCRLALIDLDDAALADVAAKSEQAGAPKAATYNVNVSSEPDVEQLSYKLGPDAPPPQIGTNQDARQKSGAIFIYPRQLPVSDRCPA